MKAENLFLLAILVLTLVFIGAGFSHGKIASLVPWSIGSVLLVLVTIAGIRIIVDPSVPRLHWHEFQQEARRLALIVGGAVFALCIIVLAGFVTMAVMFPWLYITLETRRWLLGLLVGVVLGSVIYLLGYIFVIPFPQPMLLEWFRL